MSYDAILEAFKELEKKLKDLPEISLLGRQYFPLALSRPICIEKELLKWIITAINRGDKNELRWLIDNAHIMEEIRSLEKDLENLKEDLEKARVRGEPLQLVLSIDLEKWERKWKESH